MTAKRKGAVRAAPICAACLTPRSLAAILVRLPEDVHLCDRCVKLAWDLVKAEKKRIASRTKLRGRRIG